MDKLKIITWNCGGAFRKKYHLLDEFKADVLVIQECENPESSKVEKYKEWSKNYIWHGENKNKGLAVFIRSDVVCEKLDWHDDNLKYFIPCKINEEITLIATWCHGANSPTFGYIGQLWKYMQLHKSKFSKAIIAGDFNSNVKWDKWDRWWNHSDVVRELAELKIKSLYHRFYNENAGQETKPTFYHRKNLEKSYHIDYIFVSDMIVKEINSFRIQEAKDWLQYSDHMPICCEISLKTTELKTC